MMICPAWKINLYFLYPFHFFREQSKREVDTEIDAFLSGSKSLKKPVDPLSYIKVCYK